MFFRTSDATIGRLYQLDHRSCRSCGTVDDSNGTTRTYQRKFFYGTNQCELGCQILLTVNLKNLMSSSLQIQW